MFSLKKIFVCGKIEIEFMKYGANKKTRVRELLFDFQWPWIVSFCVEIGLRK